MLEFTKSIANAIWNALLKLQGRSMAVAVACLAAVWAFLHDGLQAYFLELLEHLPPTLSNVLAPWVQYFAFANLWFPVGEWFTFFAVFMTFKTVFIVVKIVLKLIPTIG